MVPSDGERVWERVGGIGFGVDKEILYAEMGEGDVCRSLLMWLVVRCIGG